MFRHAVHEETRQRDFKLQGAQRAARAAVTLSFAGSLGIAAEAGFINLFEWPVTEGMTTGFVVMGGVAATALQASTFARSYQIYLRQQFGGSAVTAEDVGLAIMTADLESQS
jgi:hypothetical protein